MGLYTGNDGYPPQTDDAPKRVRKGVFSKIILSLVIVTVLIYTAAVLFISGAGGTIPDSLTYCFFGFFGTEIISLVTIRVNKLKGEKNNASFEEFAGAFRKNSGKPEENDRESGRTEVDSADEE